MPTAPAAASGKTDNEHVESGDPSRALSVAVIIVTYRSAQLAIDTLRALSTERLDQGLMVRAVVVDNASGDYPAIAQAVAQG